MKSAIERAALDVPDQAVDNRAEIQAILESLREVGNAHTAAVRAVTDSNRQIVEFRALAEPYERQITELEQTLDEVAIGCVLGQEDSQKTWSDTDLAIDGARRFLKQHQRAVPAFEAWAKESPSLVASLASQKQQLQMDLDKARWEAKLEIAHELAAR